MAPTNTIGLRLDEDLALALSAEANRTGTSVSELVRGPLRATYCAPRPSYGDGAPHSFVADIWALSTRGEVDGARQRLDQLQTEMAAGRGPEFALNTGNASQVIPPAYLPLVPEADTDRPLRDLCSMGDVLTSSNPFGVPGTIAAAGVGAHVEGVNPTGGSLALGGGVVAPTGISGTIDITRELADAATSAGDAVIMAAMRESYNQQTEARIAAELTTVTAGTISSGQVPTGAQVANTASASVAADTKKMLARMVKLRRRRPMAAVATADTAFAEALATALDETTGDENALWRPMGVPTNLSPDLDSASGSTAVVAATVASVWAWESQTRQFTWEQTGGPAVLTLAVFGYFGVRVLRPIGVAALRVS